MSKHQGRKSRWQQESSRRYTSALGEVVYQEGAWHANLRYRLRLPQSDPHALAHWEDRSQRLGPFKRPRNAMVALEREVTFLQNRHGDGFLLPGEVWGERDGS